MGNENDGQEGVLTVNEKKRLFLTLDAVRDDTEGLKRDHTILQEQVAKVNRGLYGDKDNGVDGALEDLRRLKKAAMNEKLKTARISGAVAVLVVGSKMLWDVIVEHIKSK